MSRREYHRTRGVGRARRPRTRLPTRWWERVPSVVPSAAGRGRGGRRRARLRLAPAHDLGGDGRGGGTGELPDLDVHAAVELLTLLLGSSQSAPSCPGATTLIDLS